MSALKPCPFLCPQEIDEDQRSPHIVMNYVGRSPLTQHAPPHTKSVKVVCAVCGCRGPEFFHSNWTREMADAEAIRLWNRRAHDRAALVEVAKRALLSTYTCIDIDDSEELADVKEDINRDAEAVVAAYLGEAAT